MVISTFLSAPIMYLSAWLLTVRKMDPQLLMNSLQTVSFNMSIVSLFALVSQNVKVHNGWHRLVFQVFATDKTLLTCCLYLSEFTPI